MSEEMDDTLRRASIEKYAGSMAEMLQQINAKTGGEAADPAELELLKSGIVNSLMPSRPRPVEMPGAEWRVPPRPKHSHIYRQELGFQTVIYDWTAIIQGATHTIRDNETGEVLIHHFDQLKMRISGDAAVAFTAWEDELLEMRWGNAGQAPQVEADFS